MIVKRFKEAIKQALILGHPLIAPFIPSKYLPYRFQGGRIYLDIKESRMMLARALGLYEVEKTKAINMLLGPGATFIDVGANKGDFSLLAAKNVGSKGKVLSFEPEPDNCRWIRESIQLNGYSNITLHEFALSDTNGEAQLYLGKKSGWHTLLPRQPNRNEGIIKVLTRTLDSILEENNEKEIDMMKIDVEGAELKVLRGAYKTLANNQNIILLIDIHPELGVSPKKVCDLLLDLGFSIYQMRPPFNISVRTDKNPKEVLARRVPKGDR